MAIALTESAARQIQKSLSKRGKGVGLRLGIKKVGCSGFAYTFDYADEVRPGDQLFEAHEAKVLVDGESLSFLDGSRVIPREEHGHERSHRIHVEVVQRTRNDDP